MIGFVVNCSEPELRPLEFYIYSSLISIFGDDIKQNVNFLLISDNNEDDQFYLWDSIIDGRLVT